MAASSEIIEEEIQQTWNKFEQSAQKVTELIIKI